MGQQIRDLMAKADGFQALRGHVEIDETYVGGRQPGAIGRSRKDKTVVLGMKQRGGRLVTEVIENPKRATIKPVVLETVEEGAIVSTDHLRSYLLLEQFGYEHGRVNHNTNWVNGIHHTNNLESFWKMFKASIRGTHVHISKKHMNRYLAEFTFRSNHRQRVTLMFDLVVGAL